MKAIKKPVEVDVIQWKGTNRGEIEQFCGHENVMFYHFLSEETIELRLEIITLEGSMKARVGDYIIRGINGEYYPCREDIFNRTYQIISVE